MSNYLRSYRHSWNRDTEATIAVKPGLFRNISAKIQNIAKATFGIYSAQTNEVSSAKYNRQICYFNVYINCLF